MTAARDLIRAVVLGTNPYWPFSQVNRWPYEAALYAVVRQVRISPHLRSVYLRVPSQQPWIPGLSDIDLTLILGCESSPDREYTLLQSFWSSYPRLKRLFPMLGEVEILDEEEVAGWLSWTIPNPAGPSWTLCYGQANAHVGPMPSPYWRRRALMTAFWVYVTHVPPCLARPDSSLRRHDIRRRVRKVLRLLAPILSEAGHAALTTPTQSDDPAELVASALRALEGAVMHVTPASAHQAPPARCGANTLAGRAGRTLLVIDDGLDAETMAGELRSAWTDSLGRRDVPVVLPRCLFAYHVHDYEPTSYATLLECRETGLVPDRLSGIPAPGREEFAAYAKDRLYHLPLFVRGPELFSQPLSIASLRNQLNSALAALVFLGRGATLPYPGKGPAHWRHALPQYVKPFEEVEGLHRSQHFEAAHQAAFRLVRSILRDARELMVP